jgi:CRISPR-associated protein Csb3
MTHPEPSFSVHADATNPGQFFACCGLLELAHRRWPGAEGWFDAGNDHFAVIANDSEAIVERLVETLKTCEVSGLKTEERAEREALETRKRKLGKGESLSADEEAHRKELGEKARKGALRLGDPFSVLLDWWQVADDEATPKTWAGRQEIHKVARAAQDALTQIDDETALFDHGCVLRVPEEYCKRSSDGQKSVEPFYFDARRFSHSLDVGFSLDVIEAETIAHPAVELLSLIGLQRFRPGPAPAPIKWSFDYWTWSSPLSAPVAASVAGGAVPTSGRVGYRFSLRFRDDQKRYKAFGRAKTIGEDT